MQRAAIVTLFDLIRELRRLLPCPFAVDVDPRFHGVFVNVHATQTLFEKFTRRQFAGFDKLRGIGDGERFGHARYSNKKKPIS
jgi:hypothetical protein